MKVLLLCTYQTPYVLQLYKYVRKYHPDVKYSLLTSEGSADYYRTNLVLHEDEDIYSLISLHLPLLWLTIFTLPRFDVVHSLWFEYYWGVFAGLISSKCDYWFASIGGSDLYRQTGRWQYRILQRRILRRCDLISSEGETTREYFNLIFNNKYCSIPHRVIRFGVDVLDEINNIRNSGENIASLRAKYNIPSDRIVIMCGTNGRAAHQHIDMLDAIGEMSIDLVNKICLLIPLTYDGTEDYKKRVEEKANTVADSVVILREFLDPRSMAEVTCCTDIMIHVQTTDQLSSAMIAHMFNGNVVIAGSWLPYEELRKKGVEFISIDKIADLAIVIPGVINELEDYKKRYSSNKGIVYGISSWELSANEWFEAYSYLLNSKGD